MAVKRGHDPVVTVSSILSSAFGGTMGKMTIVLRVLQAATLLGALAAPLASAQQAPAAGKAAQHRRLLLRSSQRNSTRRAASAATHRSKSSTTRANTRGWPAVRATAASTRTSAIRPRGR
jgi:hypothetical protein